MINYSLLNRRVWLNLPHFNPSEGRLETPTGSHAPSARIHVCALILDCAYIPPRIAPPPSSPSVYTIPHSVHDLNMNSADFGGEGPSVPEALKPLMAQYEKYSRMLQYQVDRTTPHTINRWLATAGLNALFLLRIVFAQGVSRFPELALRLRQLTFLVAAMRSGTLVSSFP